MERLSFIDDSSHLYDYCVACPRPDEPGAVFLSADGLFGLSRYQNASLETIRRDSEIENLYFVKTRANTATQAEDEDPCSNFNAGDGSSRTSPMKAQTGLFGICCCRHHTPFLYTSMSTGERYTYLDQILKAFLEKFGTN